MQPRAGTVLGTNYELVAPLGRGGMGEVWRARALDLDAPVAVKLLLEGGREAGARARFEREARAAAALRSPHVVQVLGYGVDEGSGVPFIVLELLEGETLRQRLERQGKLSASETQRWVVHIARALTRAHAAGIVHRDLKPENVFLVDNGDERIAKVLDFGVAKEFHGPTHTATGTILGTIHYMAPEQLEGRGVDHRADLWSLTVLAAECLTGGRAVEGDTFGEVATRLVLGRLRTPSSIAPVMVGFDEWFARGTRLQPDERFASAEELAQGLVRLSSSAGESSGAAVAGTEPALVAPQAPLAPTAVLLPTVADGSAISPGSRASTESLEALSVRPARPAVAPRRRRSWALAASAVALVIGGVVVARWARGPRLESAVAGLAPQASTVPGAAEGVAVTPSVALLPFDVTGGSEGSRYFADGVHGDLLARLSGVSDLRVASGAVVLRYRGSAASASQIARELGVQHVVRTQLELHDGGATWRVRVEDADDREAWSHTYERTLDDAQGLLSALSSDLVAALSPRLSASERQRLLAPASASARAYELYLEAQRDDQSYEERERLLGDAVQLDPMFARAWLALADMRSSYYEWHVRHTPEQLEAASVALGKAQSLAPEDPEVRQVAAWSYGALYGDWPRAERALITLAQALPNSGALQYMLSRVAERRGEPLRSVEHLQRAWELDPARDDYGWWLAYDQTQLRRYDEARRTLQRVQTSTFYAEAGRDVDLARLDFQQWGKAEALRAWGRGLSPAARERPEVRALWRDMAWELGDAEGYLERASDAPDGLVDLPLRQIFFGIAALDRGDRDAAERWLERAERALRDELVLQPDNARTHARLGLLLAVRGGQAEAALEHAKRALRLVPQDVDAYTGAQLRVAYTCTLAWLGERESAVRELQLALRRPYPEDHSFFFPLHVEHLEVGLEWKPLRELPAFQALLAAPESRAPF